MKVQYVTVEVIVTPRKIPVRDVLLHEVPLLQAKFGESNVKLHQRQVECEREIDDFTAEFDRLIGTYGYTSPKEDAPSWVASVYGNPLAGGTQAMETMAGAEALSLFKNADFMPEKEVAITNDENTYKVYKKHEVDKPTDFSAKDMREALETLEIEFDPKMKAAETKAFGEAQLLAKADELGLDTEGLGTSDLFNAIVEAV